MSLVGDAVTIIQNDWGWIILLGWAFWQLYCPLPNHQTKFQRFFNGVTQRLRTIEVTQVALAQEVDGVSDEAVADLHDEEDLNPSDLKDNGSDRDVAAVIQD